jgi:nucleotide-binding universal stress UspA family protein
MVYQRILVAVDSSAMSIQALQEGLMLTQESKAQLRLVHVVDVMPHGVAMVDAEALRQAVRDEGDTILHAAAELAQQAGVAAETVLLKAGWRHFSRAIVEEAARWGADLIVMGTHGHTGLARLLLGSVAEGVIHITPVPVLLVHGHQRISHEPPVCPR